MSERGDIGLIRGKVRTINESRYLRRAPQLRQMLSYVVEGSLENRESELKEHSLGVEGFQRPADFDPRVDPIVRVQARNLRSRLERYFANEGVGDTAIIEIPADSYIPHISFRSLRNAAGNQRPVRTLPRIAVLPFQNSSGNEEHEYLSDGISEELISARARFSGLRVLARTSSFSFRGKNATAREIGDALNTDYFVEGAVRIAGRRFRVSARLIEVSDRNAVWLHKQWREDHTEDFALDYLPPYSPELNPIERAWKLTRRRCLHNRYFPDLDKVIATEEEEFAHWTIGNDILRRLCAII